MVNYVVIGGGVAGVCCAEELCRICPDDSVTLVSADPILKGVSTVAKFTRNLEELKVVEKNLDALPYPNLRWVQGIATGIDAEKQVVHLTVLNQPNNNTAQEDHSFLRYDKVCICTGARPRRLLNNPHVIVLRDTDSVAELAEKLKSARRVVVVGNGGIALELAHGLHGVDLTWIVRHGHIGDAFFDIDAANFFLEELQRKQNAIATKTTAKTAQICETKEAHGLPKIAAGEDASLPLATSPAAEQPVGRVPGHAVGPAWTRQLPHGAGAGAFSVELGCEVDAIMEGGFTDGFPLRVVLNNGRCLPADVVISVIGVDPTVDWVPAGAARSPEDGGLLVGKKMETSLRGIYAAGDACRMQQIEEGSPHWFQMRLWSQARGQGVYAAHCMAGIEAETGSDMAFEAFTHVTRFLGKKVVLLGLYNGQRLENEPEEDLVSYSRVTEGDERTFVRILLLRGRIQGAVMIGETDLEETMENLILDGLDVSRYGPELLDPNVELDHVFD